LAVPVQAIVQVGKETACYVAGPAEPERCLVKLGRTNDKLVQIVEGVSPGQRVVLNPMAISDETEKPAGDEAGETEDSAEQISAAQPASDTSTAAQPSSGPSSAAQPSSGSSSAAAEPPRAPAAQVTAKAS
jgi:hypothetical protein